MAQGLAGELGRVLEAGRLVLVKQERAMAGAEAMDTGMVVAGVTLVEGVLTNSLVPLCWPEVVEAQVQLPVGEPCT